MFENATRNKIRFDYKGLLSVEDLWDLNMQELDNIYRNLTTEKNKVSNEDSLLNTKTKEDELVTIKINLVKHIFEIKQSEANARLMEKEKKEKKQKIMEILASKEENALQNKSEEELKEMLNSL